jgi:hypothetical protein
LTNFPTISTLETANSFDGSKIYIKIHNLILIQDPARMLLICGGMKFIRKINSVMGSIYVGALVLALSTSFGCSKVNFSKDTVQASKGQGTTPPPPPPGGTVTNSYFFVKRAADILFVIDNSGSMSEEQALLRSGFPSFTSALNTYSGGTLEWHVAITSTDVASAGAGKQGALVEFSGMPPNTYFLDSSTNVNQANAAFQSTVMLGTAGSGDERGIAGARMAAEKEFGTATTHGFIRADTPLSVIVLSDEDERSSQDPTNGQYIAMEPIDMPANFVPEIRLLDTASSIPKTITFHSIVTSTAQCLAGPGENMGSTYMSLSNLTNGIIGDICALNQSYQDQLNSLASSIVNEARTYTLPCNDVLAGSAKAYEQEIGGALVLVPSTFVAPNKLVLMSAPPVGSLIKAKFTCMD